MLDSLLSPGAQRVVDRVSATGTTTAHGLLVSLWTDESRAHSWLTAAGLSTELVDVAVGQPGASGAIEVAAFVEAARRFASLEGRSAEVGTEHLLMAACDFDSFRDLLAALPLDLDQLRQKLHHPLAEIATPLEANIQLRPVVATRGESVSVARILDAAANRCREGLRVVEDYTRMILNDRHLSQLIKEVRHELSRQLAGFGIERAISARDTEHDVGTSIHTAFEMQRPSVWSVVIANLKRVQESLRTLEEYGKTVDVPTATAVGNLRYRFYTIEKGLCSTQGAMERLAKCKLYLLATDSLCPQGLGPVVRAALRGGVDIVQLREKQLGDRRILELAKWVREWTAESGALFIMNDRPDLAVLAEADGVHVGQGDLTAHEARRIVGSDKLVGVSTHSIEQARQAVLDGADYIGVGPVFSSLTKEFDEFAGLEYVQQVASEITLPAFAIGGIGVANLPQVIDAGASRIAVSSEICSAEDVERVASRLKDALLLESPGVATPGL